jgi:hypothetical protein
MWRLDRLLTPLAALAVFALASCGGDDPSGPSVDPTDMSSMVDGIAADLEGNEALSSLGALSVFFPFAAGQVLSAALPQRLLSVGGLSSAPRWRAGVAERRGLASVLARVQDPSSPTNHLIPDQYEGVTLEWDINTDMYVASGRTGAPSNGVRFILYRVSSSTGLPVEPLEEIGYVDITDETDITNRVGVTVVLGSTTVADYTVSGSVSSTSTSFSWSFSAAGIVRNQTGTRQVDFELSDEFKQTTSLLSFMADMHVAATGGFAIDLPYEVFWRVEDGEIELLDKNVDLTITSGNNAAQLLVYLTPGGETVEVYYNGVLAAEGFLDESGELVLTGAGGRQLSQAEIDALNGIFERAFVVFGHMIDLIIAVFGAFFV